MIKLENKSSYPEVAVVRRRGRDECRGKLGSLQFCVKKGVGWKAAMDLAARFVAASMDVQHPSRVYGSRRRVGFSFGLGSSRPAFRKLSIGA